MNPESALLMTPTGFVAAWLSESRCTWVIHLIT